MLLICDIYIQLHTQHLLWIFILYQNSIMQLVLHEEKTLFSSETQSWPWCFMGSTSHSISCIRLINSQDHHSVILRAYQKDYWLVLPLLCHLHKQHNTINMLLQTVYVRLEVFKTNKMGQWALPCGLIDITSS